jgi:Holliday junction DNA helicase RuvA
MIGSLKGNIERVFTDNVLVDVNGVGYQVFLPGRVIGNVVEGDAVFLFIHTQVKEDDIALFGFLNADDKQMFLELIRVNGVGAKTALNVLGIMSAMEICDAISFADQARFTQVSGIGPKAAVRIINELKDRVAKLSFGGDAIIGNGNVKLAVDNGSDNGLLRDALSALENLGYQKAQILDLVKEVVKEEKDISGVISKSLKQLAS